MDTMTRGNAGRVVCVDTCLFRSNAVSGGHTRCDLQVEEEAIFSGDQKIFFLLLRLMNRNRAVRL